MGYGEIKGARVGSFVGLRVGKAGGFKHKPEEYVGCWHWPFRHMAPGSQQTELVVHCPKFCIQVEIVK